MINVINHQEEHWLRWESLMHYLRMRYYIKMGRVDGNLKCMLRFYGQHTVLGFTPRI